MKRAKKSVYDKSQSISINAGVALLRSSLFSVSRDLSRDHIKTRKVNSAFAKQMMYIGPHLSQYDHDLLLAIRYLSLHTIPDQYQIYCIELKHLFGILNKRAYGRMDYQLARESLMRLSKSHCYIEDEVDLCGRFFDRLTIIRDGKQILVRLSNAYVNYLNCAETVSLNLSQRFLLSPGLARWLQGFWSTYDVIPIMLVDTLRCYSGSDEKRRSNFKQRLRKALDELASVGFIDQHWYLTRDGTLLVQRGCDVSKGRQFSVA